ncbi:MAG TPA: hypothetical protein VN778_05255, partial [Verrucomicrobiae bacterium]|nr:hypothetical protein [Verrucomicrobiae bacterium]
MANRLPTPGGDDGSWGDILNAYLEVSHNSDGTLANNTVGTNQLQSGSVTNTQLDSATQSAIAKASNSVQQVNNKSPDIGGNVSLAASDVSAIPVSQLGAVSGVATLDGSGNVPASQLNNVPSSSVNITSPDGSITVGGTASAPTLESVVPSVFSRTGAVVARSGDYNATQIPNVVTLVTQSATPAIDTDNANFFSITGLAQAITSMTTNLTGTPVHGQFIWIEITDNGTPQAITWGSSFASASVTLPTTTVASTTVRVGLTWNTITSTWDAVAGGSASGGGGGSFTPIRTAYTTAGSNSFTIPAGCMTMTVTCIGGGGGGGSGRQGAASTACVGGAGGGGGGLSIQRFLASDFSSPVTVVVGVGGSGASAQTTADTNGTAGGSGGQSKFGTALVAGGGVGGAAGTAS